MMGMLVPMQQLSIFEVTSAVAPSNPSLVAIYSNEISLFGTAASLIGLFLSIYVVWTAKKINNYIFYNRRLPQIQKKITSHSSAISTLLNTFDTSRDEIRDELFRCAANLKSLKRNVPISQRKVISSLFSLIEIKAHKDLTKEDTREIYLQLQYIVEDIKNLQKDYQMET